MPHSIKNTGSQAPSKHVPIVSEEEYVSIITRYEVHFENLESIVIESGALLEGNCFYQNMTLVKRSELLPKQRNLFSVARVGDRIMEIGFNAGHSALLFLLANPCSKITCFDLCAHSYTKPCFNYLADNFPGRLRIFEGNSKLTVADFHKNNPNDRFDVLHIDGGHALHIAHSDFVNSRGLATADSIVIWDDVDIPRLGCLWEQYVTQGFVKPFEMLPTPMCTHAFGTFSKLDLPLVATAKQMPEGNREPIRRVLIGGGVIKAGTTFPSQRRKPIVEDESKTEAGKLTTKSRWEGGGSKGFVSRMIEGPALHKYLEKSPGKFCFEIGCSTGGSLAYLSRVFGYFPEGIDYAKNTKKIVEETLRNNGVNECNIYEEDFLSWTPSKKYDLVFSGGFIEHFSGELLKTIEDKHIALLNRGGKIVISVPNFNYGQYLIHFLLDKQNLEEHNIKTMSRRYYRNIAKKHGLEIVFLGYIGGFFDFWPRNTKLWWNPFHRMIFRGLKGFRSIVFKLKLDSYCNPILSPYLVFIARKPICAYSDEFGH